MMEAVSKGFCGVDTRRMVLLYCNVTEMQGLKSMLQVKTERRRNTV